MVHLGFLLAAQASGGLPSLSTQQPCARTGLLVAITRYSCFSSCMGMSQFAAILYELFWQPVSFLQAC